MMNIYYSFTFAINELYGQVETNVGIDIDTWQ